MGAVAWLVALAGAVLGADRLTARPFTLDDGLRLNQLDGRQPVDLSPDGELLAFIVSSRGGGAGRGRREVPADRGYAMLFPDVPLEGKDPMTEMVPPVEAAAAAALATGRIDPERLGLFGHSDESAGYDPLVLAIDEEGREKARWHPKLGENHTLWDVHFHAPTGDVFVTGETNYHREGSQTFAARLKADLEPVWHRRYESSLGRSAAYAMAPVGEGFVLAGAASSDGGEDEIRHPLLVMVDRDGPEHSRKVDESKAHALYHWVRASNGRIYAGGYGRSDGGEDTDVLADVLNPPYSWPLLLRPAIARDLAACSLLPSAP